MHRAAKDTFNLLVMREHCFLVTASEKSASQKKHSMLGKHTCRGTELWQEALFKFSFSTFAMVIFHVMIQEGATIHFCCSYLDFFNLRTGYYCILISKKILKTLMFE